MTKPSLLSCGAREGKRVPLSGHRERILSTQQLPLSLQIPRRRFHQISPTTRNTQLLKGPLCETVDGPDPMSEACLSEVHPVLAYPVAITDQDAV